MGSPTLQTLQDPILLLPWVCFRGGGFSITTDPGVVWEGCGLPQFAAKASGSCAGTRACQCTASRAPPDAETRPGGGLLPRPTPASSPGGCRWEPYAFGHWSRGHFCIRRPWFRAKDKNTVFLSRESK